MVSVAKAHLRMLTWSFLEYSLVNGAELGPFLPSWSSSLGSTFETSQDQG